MTRMIRRGAVAAALTSAWLVGGCGGDGGTEPSPPVAVSVTPASANLFTGETREFTASVTNATNGGVTWTASGGSVAGTGNTVSYTAPSSAGSYTVRATSVADPAKSATATVTVAEGGVAVTPSATTVFREETVSLVVAVTGAGSTEVTWAATCGSVTAQAGGAAFTAPWEPGDCVVTATSVADATKSAGATITVSPDWVVRSFDDATDGRCDISHCSLREALEAVVAGPDPGVIRLMVPSPGAGVANAGANTVIALTSPLPVITRSVEIEGPGAELLTLNAGGSAASPRRVLSFFGELTASVRGVRVTGGYSPAGSGVQVTESADVRLEDVVIAGNTVAGGSGAGLQVTNGASVHLENVIIEENAGSGASVSAAGISVFEASVTMKGGSVRNNEIEDGWAGGVFVLNGTFAMQDGSIEGNRILAGDGSGAGLLIQGPSVVDLVNVTVAGNEAAGEGGGLRLLDNAAVTLTNGVLQDNRALRGGGIAAGHTSRVDLNGTSISGNTAAQGGGLYVWGDAAVTGTGDSISDNIAEATFGGGGVLLHNNAMLDLTDAAIDGNRTLGANMHGAGIRSTAGTVVKLTGGSLSRNVTTSGFGAGIYASGAGATLTLDGVTVADNNAAAAGAGGGIAALGITLVVKNATISGNIAGQGAGGGLFIGSTNATIEDADIRDNTSLQRGAGAQIYGTSTVTLTRAQVVDNKAGGGGAGLSVVENAALIVNGSVISGNTSDGLGGGILTADASSLQMTDTRVTDNVGAVQGGGLQLTGTGGATLDRVTIAGNRALAGSGGGVTAGVVTTVTNSTISGNTALGTGGGFFAASLGSLTMSNTTISGNTGVIGGGLGATGPAQLTNVTIVDNQASDFGGGIGSNNAGNVRMANVLLARNTAVGAAGSCGTGNGGAIESLGHNASDDASCASTMTATGDVNEAVVGLSASLADNGGPTATHALEAGSVAIDAGDATRCPTTDQRGYSRALVCDIGAFEFNGTAQPGIFPAPWRARLRPVR